jgi:hypothetical protein
VGLKWLLKIEYLQAEVKHLIEDWGVDLSNKPISSHSVQDALQDSTEVLLLCKPLEVDGVDKLGGTGVDIGGDVGLDGTGTIGGPGTGDREAGDPEIG